VSERYAETIVYRGEEVLLFPRSLIGVPDAAGLSVIGRSQGEVLDALRSGAVAVSQNIAVRFGMSIGDMLTLDTPKGPRRFQVAALTNSFEVAGEIAIDMAVFDELWERSGSSSLLVWTDPGRERVVEEMRRRVAGLQDIFLTDTEALGRLMRADVDRFKGLLYLVTNLALLLGGICIANLLISAVAERRRELALFRASGATPGHLVAVILADGFLLSTIAAVAGLALGYACSFPLSDVLAEQYGYSLHHAVNLPDVALLAAGTGLSALLAGLYPALSARRTLPSDVFAPE
jgi:putative ABC transport system permease protein